MSYQDFDLQKALAKPERVICANGSIPEWHLFDVQKVIGIVVGGLQIWADVYGVPKRDSEKSFYCLKLLPETKRVWVHLFWDFDNKKVMSICCMTKEEADKCPEKVCMRLLDTIEKEVIIS